MPSTQCGLTQAGSPPDRAARRAGEAHQRGRRAAATGHPAAGARHLRAGLTLLGWAEDEDVQTSGRFVMSTSLCRQASDKPGAR